MKTFKIGHNPSTNEARKHKHTFGILRISKNFDVCLANFRNNQILLPIISYQFLVTAKLYTGLNILKVRKQASPKIGKTFTILTLFLYFLYFEKGSEIWPFLMSLTQSKSKKQKPYLSSHQVMGK